MAVDEVFPPRVAQLDQVVRVSASSPAGWHLGRLTDTPIQLLAIYFFLSLLLPAFLLTINDLWPIYYRYGDFSIVPGIAVISTVILACTFRHFQWANTREIAVKRQAIFIYSTQKLRIAGLLLAIVLALINASAGNSGYRYDEISLSEKGSFSLYFYALIPACAKLLLIYHSFVYRGTSAMDRFERGLVTLVLAASINGNGTAFVTVFSFILLQTNARAYLVKSTLAAASHLRLVALVVFGTALVAIAGTILIGAYVYGESVKRDVSADIVLDSLTATLTPNVLIESRSAPYVSLVNTLPLTFDFDRDSFGNLVRVWNNFLFRLEALHILDFGVDRGAGVSIMRLNYEFIDIFSQNDREGTSPGLIPGFLYCFPPILNLLMLGAYVFMALGILQRLCLCMDEEMSFIGKFILAYLTLPLFESPIDYLMILDDGFAFFVGLWWMSRLVEQVRPTLSTAWEAEPDIKRTGLLSDSGNPSGAPAPPQARTQL